MMPSLFRDAGTLTGCLVRGGLSQYIAIHSKFIIHRYTPACNASVV